MKATTRGWINPKTGELLKCQKMTQEQADAYNGVDAPIMTLNEAPSKERVVHQSEIMDSIDDWEEDKSEWDTE